MKAVIIGSGNVATHLGKALTKAQVQVSQVWSPNYENAAALAKQIGADAISNLTAIALDADICVISVKDDAIAKISDQLTGFKGLVVHTSGAVSLDVFANKFDNYGVFYPLQTFSKHKAVDFKTIPICIEANNVTTLAKLESLAVKLSDHVQEVASEKRKILHLAAVFACNFPNHLYALAEKILTDNGLDFAILRPLILETAVKVQQDLPLAVQTGPAIRNDEITMAKHEALLSNYQQCLEIYRTLSESIKKTIA